MRRNRYNLQKGREVLCKTNDHTKRGFQLEERELFQRYIQYGATLIKLLGTNRQQTYWTLAYVRSQST